MAASASSVLVFLLGSLHGGAAWDYKKNGADWSGEGFCGAGGMQSPIDLPKSAELKKDETLFLKYPDYTEKTTLYHNGYSLAATFPESYKSGFGLSSKGPESLESPSAEAYRLWQMNFHSPSEHTVAGQRLPLEIQLMHKRVTGYSDDGSSDIAVVVLLFNYAGNKHNKFLDAFVKGELPTKAWDEVQLDESLPISDIVGGSPFYSYKGGLTVPPCESKVKYFVRHEVLPASHDQLQKFEKTLGDTCGPNGNFRLTQMVSGAVNLMSSVDLVNAPKVTVKPKEAAPDKPSGYQPSSTLEFECMTKLDNFEHDAHTVGGNDTKAMIAAKEDYSVKSLGKAGSAQAMAQKDREIAGLQKLYDSAGLVHKMELKWQLIAAKEQREAAKKAMETGTTQQDAARTKLMKMMVDECVTKLKASGRGAKKPAPRLEYPEPHINLPRGLKASPFSDAVDVPKKAGTSAAKIAPNLQQPEMAPGSTLASAGVQSLGKVKKPSYPEVIMSLKLPVKPCKFDQDKLKKALAESAGVDASRIELKELHHADVVKVHTSSEAMSALQIEEHHRFHMRGSPAQFSSELVQPEALK